MVEEDEKQCESIDSIIEEFSKAYSKIEDEKDDTAVETAKKSKIDPNAFFKNLRDKGGQNRESNKDTANNGEVSKKSVADFKKKLFLKNIDTN